MMAGGDEFGGMTKLPEGCISHLISLTTPRDCCRSAAVSATFRSAAESDTVWERFLPSDLSEILSRAVDTVDSSTSKRDLYFRLCDGILIDGARMSFSLERSTGRKCYTLSARELMIVWGDTPHYWRWGPRQDSRFPEVAELVHVCWLEIRGKLDRKALSQRTSYAAYLIFKLADNAYNLNIKNQVASVRVGSCVSENEVCLQPDEAASQARQTLRLQPDEAASQARQTGRPWINYLRRAPFRRPHEVEETRAAFRRPHEVEETRVAARAPDRRHDGWMEMELGEFFNGDGDEGEVEMSLLEVKGGHWKAGLIVEGLEVRPK